MGKSDTDVPRGDFMKMYYVSKEIPENEMVWILEDTHAAESEHMHDFVEIVYVQEGDVIHGVGDKYMHVHSGGMVYIDVGQEHLYFSTGKVKFINISIKKDFFDEQVFDFIGELKHCFGKGNENHFAQFEGTEKQYMDDIVNLLLVEYKSKNVCRRELVNEYVKILFALMARKLCTQNLESMKMDLKSYIELHCFDNIGVEEIAEVFGYNPNYLSKKFKSEYGVSIKSYINTLRVKAAVQMLENTDFSIERIAICVGYTDAKQIYQVFKKYFGMTPGSIRGRKNNEDNK